MDAVADPGTRHAVGGDLLLGRLRAEGVGIGAQLCEELLVERAFGVVAAE